MSKKLSELSNFSNMVGKVKSMLTNLTVPANTEKTEALLAQEEDPKKRHLLEVELLINQLQDIQIIQEKTMQALLNKFKVIRTDIIDESATESTSIEKNDQSN